MVVYTIQAIISNTTKSSFIEIIFICCIIEMGWICGIQFPGIPIAEFTIVTRFSKTNFPKNVKNITRKYFNNIQVSALFK